MVMYDIILLNYTEGAMERKSLLTQIQEKYAKMKRDEALLDEEEIKLKKRIDNARKVVDDNRKEIKALGETIIPVNVETLVCVVAEELGVSLEDLTVDVFFEHSVKGKHTKEQLVKYWEDNQSIRGSVYTDLIIRTKEKNYQVSFRRRLKLNQHQKDGSRLIDFLDVETKKDKYGAVYETNYFCSDYKNLRFYYRLNEIININKGKLHSPYMGLAYKAYEIDSQKKYQEKLTN